AALGRPRQWPRVHGGGVPGDAAFLWHQAKANHSQKSNSPAIVERLHLILGKQLRATVSKEDRYLEDLDALVQTCAWSIRMAAPSNAPYTPGQLAFAVDMLFRQKIAIDWEAHKRRRRQQAIQNNAKENKNRIEHVYKVNDLVLIMAKKYERAKGPKISRDVT
ncbi:hypothetical protein ACHAWF_000680, partial [Thalassiosira exigua]